MFRGAAVNSESDVPPLAAADGSSSPTMRWGSIVPLKEEGNEANGLERQQTASGDTQQAEAGTILVRMAAWPVESHSMCVPGCVLADDKELDNIARGQHKRRLIAKVFVHVLTVFLCCSLPCNYH